MTEAVGDRFQQETKYIRGELPGGALDWENKPELFKRYPESPQVALPRPSTEGGEGLWSVLSRRRSVRRYGSGPLRLEDLSQVLWAAQGITRLAGDFALRTAPSAGALYPVETYLAAHDVEYLTPGLYHYAIEAHALEQLQLGDLRVQVAHAALDQRMGYDAQVVLIWTALFERSKWKYKQRAYRYLYLDAGHIVQNVALAAVALGLGSCQVAALYDDEANALLGVDGEQESVIYMTALGKERE